MFQSPQPSKVDIKRGCEVPIVGNIAPNEPDIASITFGFSLNRMVETLVVLYPVAIPPKRI